MKTTLLLLIICMTLFNVHISFGAKFRVNNNAGVNAPYSSLTAAYNAASAGDTIYIESSPTSYGDLALYKPLVLIGSGYYLSQNPETQANKNASTIGNLIIGNSSCSGLKISGLTINVINIYWTISSFNITRCKINTIGYGSNVAFYNTIWEQNIITYMDLAYNPNFYNSYIRNNYIGSTNYGSFCSSNNTLLVTQNVFNAISLNNVMVTNNIITGNSSFPNCFTSNNICSGTQLAAINGNQQNVDMNTVFVCWSNCTGFSDDGRYMLKTGSPAIGAGANGEDCGMYGGSFPYQLSGLPAIPAIYYFNYNFNNASVNIDLKVKSHN